MSVPKPSHPILSNLIAFIERQIANVANDPALLAALQALLTKLLAGVKSGNNSDALQASHGTAFGPFIGLVVAFLEAHPELVSDFEAALTDLLSQSFPVKS
jgi:hypothetical protein